MPMKVVTLNLGDLLKKNPNPADVWFVLSPNGVLRPNCLHKSVCRMPYETRRDFACPILTLGELRDEAFRKFPFTEMTRIGVSSREKHNDKTHGWEPWFQIIDGVQAHEVAVITQQAV